jgi:hypothetical protein
VNRPPRVASFIGLLLFQVDRGNLSDLCYKSQVMKLVIPQDD